MSAKVLSEMQEKLRLVIEENRALLARDAESRMYGKRALRELEQERIDRYRQGAKLLEQVKRLREQNSDLKTFAQEVVQIKDIVLQARHNVRGALEVMLERENCWARGENPGPLPDSVAIAMGMAEPPRSTTASLAELMVDTETEDDEDDDVDVLDMPRSRSMRSSPPPP